MKSYRETGLGLYGGELLAWRPGRFYPIDDPVSTLCVKVEGKFFTRALTEHRAMKAYWGNGGIAPRILDLGTRWRWVAGFTPVWTRWWREKFPAPPGTRTSGHPARISVNGIQSQHGCNEEQWHPYPSGNQSICWLNCLAEVVEWSNADQFLGYLTAFRNWIVYMASNCRVWVRIVGLDGCLRGVTC
jgi:hypothetical protein